MRVLIAQYILRKMYRALRIDMSEDPFVFYQHFIRARYRVAQISLKCRCNIF